MIFPHEAIPDGNVWGPHHFYIAFFAAMFILATVWDNYRDHEPVFVAAGLLISLFGFSFIWPFYPVVGSMLCLLGLSGSSGAIFRPYWQDFPRSRVLTAVFLAVAWDDALEHAFGLPTPLDWIWGCCIYPYMM